VRYFDPLEKRWHNASPMYTPRCYVSTAHLNDHIYACGGYDGRFRLNSVERYHPPTNQWTKVASMTVNRSDAGADSLHGEGKRGMGRRKKAGRWVMGHSMMNQKIFNPKKSFY
jgi:N-acetylneuraminic acid mutarotase